MRNLEKKQSYSKYFYILLTIILLALLWFIAMKTISWFDTYSIHKQRVLSMTWKWPISIQKREAPKEVVKEVLPEYEGQLDTPIKKYIADKFGIENAKVALGIVASESNFNEEAWHANSDGSIDLGIWQINSTHFKQEGCSIKEVLDPIRATDCAYNIYKASGWRAWTSFANGSVLAHL